MKITRELLRRWGACYDDEEIAALVPECGLTPLEIADLDNMPVEDRLWVLLREELVTEMELRLLACDWAESACRKAGWNDARSLNAIAVARRHAIGEATETELAEAAKGAWEARSWAWSSSTSAWSPRGAAAEASVSAAWSEAAKTAEWAVMSAAWWSAEGDAAEATRSEQLADVVRVLRKIEGGKKE